MQLLASPEPPGKQTYTILQCSLLVMYVLVGEMLGCSALKALSCGLHSAVAVPTQRLPPRCHGPEPRCTCGAPVLCRGTEEIADDLMQMICALLRHRELLALNAGKVQTAVAARLLST